MKDDLLAQELVDRIRERDEAAFAVVYQLLASDLLSFAAGMLRDRGAAEDAVQQSFLELARAAPTITGDGRSLRAWLYKSVRFSCLDEIRRRGRHPDHPTDVLPEIEESDPELPDPELRDALMQLPERQRTIVLLRHVTGFSTGEVARIVGTTSAGVYASSARAERSLKRILGTVENGNDPASERVRTQSEREGTGRG